MTCYPLSLSPLSRPLVRRLGRRDYESTWREMQRFTQMRTPQTPDELWLLEHPPVYTLGQAGKPEHRLHDNDIPMLKVDRGGQITYHGPGQVVLYTLVELARYRLKVKELVYRLEQAVIDLLGAHHLGANRRRGAPGVYVGKAKIAAVGLRIKKGAAYHGLSLNVGMDLSPYDAINPCGYEALEVTQTRDCGLTMDVDSAGEALARHVISQLDQAR